MDISKYTDFSFFETVWFWDHLSDSKNPHIGRWIGVSHHIGAPLTYFVLESNDQVKLLSTVQHVTETDKVNKDIDAKNKLV